IERLLGSGAQLGMRFQYAAQPEPKGIAQAFVIGEKFVGGDPVCLILGDNIFYGHELSQLVQKSAQIKSGAEVFAYHVHDPERYGVVEFGTDKKAVSVEEKPKKPKSSWAVTGLYFYDNDVIRIARNLKPSPRGELEITDVNRAYLEKGLLRVIPFSRGVAWLDTGTFDSLLQSSHFVQTIEQRQGLMVACPEEIAWLMGYISDEQLDRLGTELEKSGYGLYLKRLLQEKRGR
ncbi:MAG: glucose-1-phosphate thymidylyltransferase, partial [Bdellovibrionales bacterium]|nr:glucose-1-phosphate thymidylyltransferase [Bdellovibrionales bacterium]